MWWSRRAAAKKFIDEVVAECEMSDVARKAAASKTMRAIGIEVMHKQAYMMATLVQELRNEQQFMSDFANGVAVWMTDNDFLLLGKFIWGFASLGRTRVLVLEYSYSSICGVVVVVVVAAAVVVAVAMVVAGVVSAAAATVGVVVVVMAGLLLVVVGVVVAAMAGTSTLGRMVIVTFYLSWTSDSVGSSSRFALQHLCALQCLCSM